MNQTANIIKNRLSLRPPQEESLNILAQLADILTLRKDADLTVELEKVRELHPTCTDFERNFPSICFSLATGVGKTRLMGAFVTYLFQKKGITNFFILAPNLTVYNKLIDDFSNTHSPKYVFRGIADFAVRQPKIITADNYTWEFSAIERARKEGEVCINFFNISKINAETRKGQQPQIKRLWEYIGDSYFNYLTKLEDLVLIMDESHHYRADRGMTVLNELNSILGLEVTATPQVEKSGRTIKFKNVVYEYSLAKAIRDGFVKEPAVATRKDFDPDRYSNNLLELDQIKLEDGIRLHEKTKVELDIYARDNKKERVKPFVLVVAKDTQHAAQLKEIICSPGFFDGYYTDKVMEIHSNQTGTEKEENIQNLMSVEEPDNPIEIVIHVNMLKEGWDVTNLYTIVPLRTAASTTLREQTIGRGLRLPYGRKTGNSSVDKLTIMAHDKFQEIVDAANKADSIIRLENIITIDPDELEKQRPEVAISLSNIEKAVQEKRAEIATIPDETVRQKEEARLEVREKILSYMPKMGKEITSVSELKTPEVKKSIIERIRKEADESPQYRLFVEEEIKEVEQAYDDTIEYFSANIIEIPRIMLQQGSADFGFHDFDLDVSAFNYQPVSEDLLIQALQSNTREIVTAERRIRHEKPEDIIINELVNFGEIDYDSQSGLLYKLVFQLIEHFKSYLNDEDVLNVVLYHKMQIGRAIYSQMMEHFYLVPAEYEKPLVHSFTVIHPHNYIKLKHDKVYYFTETIEPARSIPSKIFTGFKKSCHSEYKFDSKTEKDFAIILENDNAVQKWLRPAKEQFHIYWKHNSKRYEPDFIVETADGLYMVETKKEADVDTDDVQEKKNAALVYCKHATDFTTANGGKPWHYLLIPHDVVKPNMTFARFATEFKQ